MNTRTLGLVGLGYWGKNILRCSHELGALRIACDADARTLAAHRAAYPGVAFTDRMEDVFRDSAVRAVVIATPAATHAELARRALEAGKDVFVEKPLALTVADGEMLVRIAAEQHRVLMVGHILQYHPAVEALQDLVRHGALGAVRYCSSNRLNIGKLRTEENIWWSFAPHDVSVMLSLLGDPYDVQAFGGSYVSPGIFDTTVTTFGFPNGVKGHIYVSWIHPYKEQRFVVVGSDAMVVFDDCAAEKLVCYEHRITWDGAVPVAQRAPARAIPIRSAEPLREELAHFLMCVETRATPRTDGAEGLRGLRVLESAQRCLERLPVRSVPSPAYASVS